MPTGEALDEEYVISLLTKDADANKKRYLTNSGFGSLLSSKPRANAPKPNTRFLKSIIRETDSHNAALKAKEEAESQSRLRSLRWEHDNGKRKRHNEPAEESSSKRVRGDNKPGRWANALGGLGQKSEARKTLRVEERERDVHDAGKERLRHGPRDGRKRSRDCRDDVSRDRRRHATKVPQSRSRSPDQREARRTRKTNHSRSRSPLRHKPSRASPGYDEDNGSDSDPLHSIIGPKPPPKVRPRGRGALNANSAIDARFDPSYDPKADVDLLPEDGEGQDDWDMALEALRDRAKWRTQGADRLRSAGFSEEEVGKWEKGNASLSNGAESGGEKDVENVRWRKAGEDREWDRGKTLNSQGNVDVGPEWGRLKGT